MPSAAMTPPRLERRLAAILAADVAGYSRLMGTDEVGTLNALKAHRGERVDPAIARHNGRIVKTTGDGLLVEFASVVDAVGCAVAIQRVMLAFNADIHVDRQVVLRIGINVGDIIIDGGDIFGDGVNVAARLEALCEPGGICISRYANEQVRDKLSLTFADLGEQTVKNIARAVGVFGLTAKDIAALPEEALPAPEPPKLRTPLAPVRRRPAGAMVAGGIAVVAILAAGGWWTLHDRPAPPVEAVVVPVPPQPVAYSPQDRRQSIIVLPFENSSGDPTLDSIAAAITRDVHDRIAADSTKPLIPVGTASAYRGKTLDLHAIGRDHDVHFALTGNARRQDGRLIVSATLYETAAVRPVWSQRFDHPESPDAWGSITVSIADSINQATVDAEVARATRDHPDSLDKRDLMFVAKSTALQQGSKANFLARIALNERALALDPNYVWALREGALNLAFLIINEFSANRDADLALATNFADRALQLAPNDVSVLRSKAIVLRAKGDLDEAAALLRKVIELAPQWGWPRRDLGQIMLSQGHYKEALEAFVSAKRLISATGVDSVAPIDWSLAMGLLVNDRFPEAIAQARLAIGEIPPEMGLIAEAAWLVLIAAESTNGQDAEARADLQKFLATPRTLRTTAEIQKFDFLAAPELLDGLRRAGMPEG
ncbi:MAG TPA: adenylate/guanylate cyclase domain-containing protein [Acetobacteraceae bacterium]|nr:adenylate/guanylate cyclase domain-containing protein [Acetobacteraceae bacterium]